MELRAPKAKRIIYLFQSGGPAQQEHQFQKELDPEIESRIAQYDPLVRYQ